MSNNISQEYIFEKSGENAKQIEARAVLNKPQPVMVRVIAFLLGMVIMALLQLEQSASPMVIGILTIAVVICLQLAVDNWHTRKQLKAVINILKTADDTVSRRLD